ncbi:nitroreductase family protein, partial [Eggerthella sp.]
MRDRHEVLIDEARCIGCGLCREDCPAANIVVEQGKAAVISQDCLMCGHCVAICPQAAVTMTGFEEEPRELDAGAPTALDPDRLQQALGARRSIRRFADRPVPDDVFARIVEAGRLTPTAKNEQDVSFVVLRDDIARFEARAVRLFRRVMPFVRLTSSMARRTSIDDRFFFKGAPAVIV